MDTYTATTLAARASDRENETMSGKHTPGPWQDAYGDYKPASEPSRIIGNVDCDVYDDGSPRPIYTDVCEIADNDDHDANARLIIAAPDLLEALKGLLKHACIADAAPDDVDEEDRAFERAARAAIAKAETA